MTTSLEELETTTSRADMVLMSSRADTETTLSKVDTKMKVHLETGVLMIDLVHNPEVLSPFSLGMAMI